MKNRTSLLSTDDNNYFSILYSLLTSLHTVLQSILKTMFQNKFITIFQNN
jgi:hypothetical protein